MAGHSRRPKGRQQVEEGESWSPHEVTGNQPAPTAGRLADLLQPQGFGELRPYEPSFRDNLVARIGTTGQALGLGKYRAWDTGRRIVDLLDWTTPVGMPIALDEARRAYRDGDLVGTALGVVGGVPLVGRAVVKGVKAGGRILAGQVARNPSGAAPDALAQTAAPLPAQLDGTAVNAPTETAARLPAQPTPEAPLASSPHRELDGIFREGVQPSVPQTPIPRYDPPRGVPARTAELITNSDVRGKVIETVERGTRMGGLEWYNAEPLRLAFIDELGVDEGTRRFKHFIDLVAAASPRSRVPINVRNASFYYQLFDRLLPDKNPEPYGHLAQKLHRMNVERVWGQGLDPIRFPKLVSFADNLRGNYLPVTIDMHAFRLPTMLSGDTRFLATFLPTKGGVPRNIRREFEAGLISPEELGSPDFWAAQPRKTEYAAMERFYQDVGREMGLTGAQAQSAAWLGGSLLTRLGSDPSMSFMDFFKERLLKTAIEKGMDPRDVLKRVIRGEMPLAWSAPQTGPAQRMSDFA